MSNRYYRKPQKTILELLVVGIFKALWWLIKLPFSGFKRRKKATSSDRAYILEKKQEIREMIKGGSVAELKHAVVAADKLVDYKFKILGYKGNSFAERLRNAEQYIESNMYNRIWRGHKVRNRIAHEYKLEISEDELQKATDSLLDYLDQ